MFLKKEIKKCFISILPYPHLFSIINLSIIVPIFPSTCISTRCKPLRLERSFEIRNVLLQRIYTSLCLDLSILFETLIFRLSQKKALMISKLIPRTVSIAKCGMKMKTIWRKRKAQTTIQIWTQKVMLVIYARISFNGFSLEGI